MSSFSGLMNNAALMLTLLVIYDTFGLYAISKEHLRNCLTGALVGIFGIIVMLNPWSLQPGVFFDTRWVLLSLCGLFFGFPPTAVAVIIMGAFRLYQGGPGGTVGTIVIVTTACVGVGWNYWRRNVERPIDWKELYIFGVAVQVVMLSCMFLMPPEMRIPILKAIALPILLVFPILTMLIGLILKKQQTRRETEKELEENRQALSIEKGILRGVITSIPDLIFLKNTDGVYLGCNQSFEHFVGKKEQGVINKRDHDLFDQETADLFKQKDKEMFEAKQLLKNEEWVEYPDGRKVLLETVRSPFMDLDGTLQGLVGICRDITERKKTETQLAAQRERLAVTLRSIGDGVITTDAEGNILTLNTVAEDLTGWSQAEASGKPFTVIFRIINQITREECANPVTEVLANGMIIEFAHHTILIAKDGTERIIADSAAPILDTDNQIVGVVLVFRDVTEQKKTEQELLKAQKLESISTLAGGIAHDFNNILTAILGNLNLAFLDSDLNHKTRKLLSEAEKASIRARDLAMQLLTFAKGGKPIKELLSISNVIKDSADFILHGNKVACLYTIPDDLWLVNIDKGQIGQVIQNLVLNASHAMSEGGIISITCKNVSSTDLSNTRIHNKLDLSEHKDFVEVSLKDEGTGIPSEIVDKIFDPYFSTKEKGSGLGLSIAHSIITNHDGYIFVESTPGVGTIFTFYLPASRQKNITKPVPENSNHTQKEANILVMDDEEMVRDVCSRMLTQLGHSVSLAKDGEEALQIYKSCSNTDNKFDLVIMDLTIPGGMGGKDAVQELLKFDPVAKVIVSSGYSEDPIMAKCKEFGFCASIVKPYRLQDLSSTIHQVLG